MSKRSKRAMHWGAALTAFAIAGRSWRQRQRDKAKLAVYVAQTTARPPLAVWPQLPAVSILLAAWNEEAHIGRFLQSFHALHYPNKQLVLCAGGNDKTLAIAQAAAAHNIVVLPQAGGMGKQRALHHAFPHTTGHIVYLTDADCTLDDDSFERTIYPLAMGTATVSTGESQPLRTQLENRFVVWQAMTDLYGILTAPELAVGLLGRNCAVERTLLASSGGLAAEAVTGTDYVLAKMLLSHGATIYRVTHSRIETDYPTTLRLYLRQQRRWLRNVAMQGRRFGAWQEVRLSLQTSLVGLVMLMLPVMGLIFSPLLLLWALLFWQTLLARWRYWRVGCVLLGIRPKSAHLILLPFFVLIDFVAWASTLFDYASSQRLQVW